MRHIATDHIYSTDTMEVDSGVSGDLGAWIKVRSPEEYCGGLCIHLPDSATASRLLDAVSHALTILRAQEARAREQLEIAGFDEALVQAFEAAGVRCVDDPFEARH